MEYPANGTPTDLNPTSGPEAAQAAQAAPLGRRANQRRLFCELNTPAPPHRIMSKKEANPYELKRRGPAGGPPRPARAAGYTETEQREKLTGYVSVPREFWPFIKYSTHVRYIEKTGEFRSGGFVLKNPFDTKVKGGAGEKRFFKLQNGFNRAARDHKEWILAYEDAEYVYAKGAGVELTVHHDLQTAVKTLNANIKRLADYCKKLERRVGELEDYCKRHERR